MTIKISAKSSQEWMPLDKVFDDGIFISNNQCVKLIKIIPINYDLKSDLEKDAILNSYKSFLKICHFNIQILIQTKKENLDSCISHIQNQMNKENNKNLIQISNMYIEYIHQKILSQSSSSKNFYISISSQLENNEFNIKSVREDLNSKYLKIKDTLSRCGNLVLDINQKKDVERIMNSFYNFRKSLRLI